MDDLFDRASQLSPAKQALLQKLLIKKSADTTAPEIIPPRPTEGPIPLSFAQERLWFLAQLDPHSVAYTLLLAVQLHGPLELVALQRSLDDLVQRHEVLRTTFVALNGQPQQQIAAQLRLALPLLDLQSLAPALRARTASLLAQQLAALPFDLARGPLLRFLLLRFQPDEHTLLLTLHHSIADGWSLPLLLHDLALAYTNQRLPNPAALPALPIQYADYALWQRARLTPARQQQLLATWQQLLGDAPLLLTLPSDHPRPPIQRGQGTALPLALSGALTQALYQRCRQAALTPFMLLLSGWLLVLHRVSGQAQLLIGTPTAGRARRELEPLIGCFVNLLVLRGDLRGDPTGPQLLARVQQSCLAAYAVQEFPFELLVEALQPERDLSRNPLFQVLFALQNTPSPVVEVPGMVMQLEPVAIAVAKLDLSLTMTETPDGLVGMLEYDSALFDAPTIQRLAQQFRRALEQLLAATSEPISALNLLNAAEQQQLLVEWNDSAHAREATSLPQLLAAQAVAHPDAIAVLQAGTNAGGGVHLSYAALLDHAHALAALLHERGVGAEQRVGVCLERSPLLLIALLGVLAAGAAYVPLDPHLPRARLDWLCEQAGLSLVLVQGEQAPLAELNGSPVLVLDAAGGWRTRLSVPPPGVYSPDQLAYVLYTSGSTGAPKGVMVSHRAICNQILWRQTRYQLTHADRVLQSVPFTFDPSVWELFGPLAAGAQLVLAWPGGHQDSAYLVRTIAEHKITIIQRLPSMLRLLLQEQGIAQCTSLRHIICGGEPLPDSLRSSCFARLDTELHNLYGPTETAVDATAWSCPRDQRYELTPIGRPITNMVAYVLDAGLQPTPIGVVGELWIGGVGLARGYFGRPDLTAERFVPNPWGSGVRDQGSGVTDRAPDPRSPTPGTRLYKTGDLARYRSDGCIEFLGRADEQIKLRGYRIEPGEIEAVLAQHPAVGACVVVARASALPARGHSEQRLVAYVVPASNAQRPPGRTTNDESQSLSHVFRPFSLGNELRAFLAVQLPDYMVPSLFVSLERLPLTASGKVDRAALPEPEQMDQALARNYVAPRTPVEQSLAMIWAEVLRLDRVGVHDNFFELGGDSILSIQIVARAHQAQLHFTAKQFFQNQTIATLAQVVSTTNAISVEQNMPVGPVPLMPIQHWFFEQHLPNPHHWNQAVLLEVSPNASMSALEQSIRVVFHHHDALRLRFVQDEIGYQQIMLGLDVPASLSHLDLAELPALAQAATLEAAAAELQASLNISSGPLVRFALFHFGAQAPSRLLIVVHHLLVDGVSWRIMLEDLQTAYYQINQSAPVALPPKTTSFQQWAQRQAAYAQAAELDAEHAYWLAEPRMHAHPLPTDYQRDPETNTVASAQTVSMLLDSNITHALLHEVPAVYHTQINDVLLTALAQAFVSWTGTTELLVDLETHGRENLFDDVDLSRTIGWCTAIFPVLLDVEPADDPGRRLQHMKEQLRQIPNRGIGYGILRYLRADSAVAERLRALPQAEVSFNYLGQFDQAIAATSLFRPARESAGLTHSPLGYRRYLLEINGEIFEGRLQLHWTYSEQLHQRATIERLVARFEEELCTIIAHCQNPDAGGYTPSDFPDAGLSQEELDSFIARMS